MISLTLPWPPSANVYYRNFRGRMVISAAARAYREQCGWQAVAAGVTSPLVGNYAVTSHFYFPYPVKGDLSNREKVLFDALNKIVWIDDGYEVEGHRFRHYDKLNPRVELEVEAR